MSVHVRPESAVDVPAIHAITAAAFLDASRTDHNEQFIIDALRVADALALSLVAEVSGRVVGHVAISPVTVEDGTPGWFGLGPLSVQPEHQQQGIGSRLVRDALRRLRDSGAAGCVVLGDPSYYAQFGFRPEPGLVLPGMPPEYFQAVSFTPNLPRGAVSYHAAFAARSA